MTMLLQHAIILGDPLKRSDPRQWLSPDGSCGCAFGGALLAVGIDPAVFNFEWQEYQQGEWPSVTELWPWLTSDHLFEISGLYAKVCEGKSTIESVAAYVRTIEPIPTEQSSASIFDREEVAAL